MIFSYDKFKKFLIEKNSNLLKIFSIVITLFFFGVVFKNLYISDDVKEKVLKQFYLSLNENKIQEIIIYRNGIKVDILDYKYVIKDKELIHDLINLTKGKTKIKLYSIRFNQIYHIMLVFKDKSTYTFLYSKEYTINDMIKRDLKYNDVGQLSLLNNPYLKEGELKAYPDVAIAFYYNGLISFLTEKIDKVVMKNPRKYMFSF